jgi:hypothetical protein
MIMRIRLVPAGLLLAIGAGGPLVAADGSAGSAVRVLRKLDYRYFLAGGTCAAISHGITTPIDVVGGSWIEFPSPAKAALEEIFYALRP